MKKPDLTPELKRKRTISDHQLEKQRAKQRWLEQNQPGEDLLDRWTFELIQTTATWPKPDEKLRDYHPAALRYYGNNLVGYLASLAKKDNLAALEVLAKLALDATHALDSNLKSEQARNALRPLARTLCAWPILQARKTAWNKRNENLLKELSLGADHRFSEELLRRTSRENRSTWAALKLLCELEDMRRLSEWELTRWGQTLASTPLRERIRNLPCFTPDSWREWFDAVWALVLEQTNNHPEDVVEFERLGIYRKEHDTAKRTGRLMGVDANIRDGAKNALKQAVKRLATPH